VRKKGNAEVRKSFSAFAHFRISAFPFDFLGLAA